MDPILVKGTLVKHGEQKFKCIHSVISLKDLLNSS